MTGITDVHCHLLPHVDDGAGSLDESIEMIKLEYECGVRRIIVTPHYRRGMFETAQKEISFQFQRVKERAESLGIGMELYLGCEMHVNTEMVEMLNQKKIFTMADSRYVLTEFSYYTEKSKMRDALCQLRSAGYVPVIAHLERYEKIWKDVEFIRDIVETGAKVQINAGSITGENGRAVKKFCRKLMKEDLLHFVGSDGHGIKYRRPEMAPCIAYLEKKMGKGYMHKVLIENPNTILEK